MGTPLIASDPPLSLNLNQPLLFLSRSISGQATTIDDLEFGLEASTNWASITLIKAFFIPKKLHRSCQHKDQDLLKL
jgi:hypothetical protein